MLKKFVSIFMIYSALAFMLGHNFIGHHHHDFEHNEVEHQHNDGHHHDKHSDSEEESEDWGHLFSGIYHSADGVTFLSSHTSTSKCSKRIPQFTAHRSSNLILSKVIIEVRQNAPPYITDNYNSQKFIPCGLRAPPISIV